jgi:hypothetical protein
MSRSFGTGAITIGASVAAGVAMVAWPGLSVAGLAAAALVGVTLAMGHSMPRIFLGCLAGLLTGYALLGRGFSYLGTGRLFVGEAVLFLGLLSVLVSGTALRWRRNRLLWVLVGFAAWGAVRTVPFLQEFGWLALRDAAVWGYAGFALLVASTAWRVLSPESLLGFYRRLAFALVIWTPFALLVYRLTPRWMPQIPGRDIPIVQIEPGDACVHLAGAAAFMVLGLNRDYALRSASWLKEWMFWVAWVAGVLIASSTRGGLLALMTALLILISVRARGRWGKVLFLVVIVTTVWLLLDFEVDLDGGRSISPQQIAANLGSVLGLESQQGLAGSRTWRLSWWDAILDYTVFGPYFWIGKGFGVNLADDDGFQVLSESALRSPHSAHMNILARTGVPGLLLWSALQITFAGMLIRAYRVANRHGDTVLARAVLWLLTYWCAFLVNMSFDVTLEGPHGGIWFWCLVGIGIFLAERSRVLGSTDPGLGERVLPSVHSGAVNRGE